MILILTLLTALSFFGCEEGDALRNRPTGEPETDPDFELESINMVREGEVVSIDHGNTNISIRGSTTEDSTIRIRTLKKPPERDALVDIEPSGDVIHLSFYSAGDSKSFSSTLHSGAFDFTQTLFAVDEPSDLKFAVITNPGQKDENINLVSNSAIDQSILSLLDNVVQASIQLVVTDAIIFAVEIKERNFDGVIIIDHPDEITSTGEGISTENTKIEFISDGLALHLDARQANGTGPYAEDGCDADRNWIDLSDNNIDGLRKKFGLNCSVLGLTFGWLGSGEAENPYRLNLQNQGYVDLGVGDELVFSSDQKFSISSWIKTTANAIYISSKMRSNGAGLFGYETFINTDGKFVFNIDSSNSGYFQIVSETVVNDGKWHHLTATYNNKAMAVFVDGVLEKTGTHNLNFNGNGTNDFTVGARHFDAIYQNYFEGEIAVFSVYGRALDAGEIRQNCQSYEYHLHGATCE